MTLPRQFFSRCPSCLRNFVNIFCYFTCDPNQSKFVYIDPNNTIKYGDKGQRSITVANYTISHNFANGMYNSCRDVQLPSNNQKAIEPLCGKYASNCTVQRWLDYLGDKANTQTPFTINFTLSDTDIHIGNITLTPMNESITPCDGVCSCQDCRSSCGVPLPPIKPEPPCKIIGVDCGGFIGFTIFAIFVIFFGTYLIWHYTYCKREPQGKDSDNNGRASVNDDTAESPRPTQHVRFLQPSCLELIGAKVEEKFRQGFSAWGRLCARRPYIVMIASVVVTLILIGGIARIKVTTDPVELWSAPNSRAREERDYFDKNFK